MRAARKIKEQRSRLNILIAPALLFLFLFFIGPIGYFMSFAVGNPEVRTNLPSVLDDISRGGDLASDTLYDSLGRDLVLARDQGKIGIVARRLNYNTPGFLSLLSKTANGLKDLPLPYARNDFVMIDARWADDTWMKTIALERHNLTPYYLLSALDLKLSPTGSIEREPGDRAIFIMIFVRSFSMSLMVTIFCLLLGYPLAFFLSRLPQSTANLLMILVLLPFWTSILVRTSAWVMLLQKTGPFNSLLISIGAISEPLNLIFNRTGVYVAMTHVLLPYMVLPLYGAMKRIPEAQWRAASILGAANGYAFRRVFFPQSLPGVGAGCLLVFIMALGFYITPLLVGGAGDQMVSYYIAFFTNQEVNWGMAAALGLWLLLFTLLVAKSFSRLIDFQSGGRR